MGAGGVRLPDVAPQSVYALCAPDIDDAEVMTDARGAAPSLHATQVCVHLLCSVPIPVSPGRHNLVVAPCAGRLPTVCGCRQSTVKLQLFGTHDLQASVIRMFNSDVVVQPT